MKDFIGWIEPIGFIGAGGSGPTPPVVPSMALGMNVAWINSWAKAWVFSNLMYHAAQDRASGTGTWTQDQGLITTTDQDDVFRFVLSDVEDWMPFGTYTVLNPEGLQVQVGGYGVPGTWRTDTEFTFDVSGGAGSRCIFVKGNLTNAQGNLAVIAPGHLEKWLSGNVWHDDFIAFHQGMKCSPLRLMDWTVASGNIEMDWSDRAVPTKPTLRTAGAGAQCVPYEFMCDLAARLNTDIWVCVPPRATPAYVEQMAALFASQLPPGRKLWLELGNEIWNTADPWGDGSQWISYLDHTRRTAVADVAGQKFALAGHGLSNGAQIRSFATIDNRSARAADAWQLRLGIDTFVKVLNAGEFELYADAGLTSKITIPDGQVNLLFVVTGEAGKTADMNTHYGELCLRNWDIFDAAMGVGRIKHLVASMAVFPAHTAGRLAVPGVQGRTDYVAIAPYFNGEWCGARLTSTSGSITPGWWGAGSRTVHIGVYASGATPSIDDVIAGTGAVSKQAYSYTSGANTYSNAAQVTGLTNGTSYAVHFVFADQGVNFRIVGTVSPSAGGSTVYAFSEYEDQLLRHQLDTLNGGLQYLADHQAVSGGIPLICYEGGLHYHQSAPPEMSAWLATYQESPEFAEAIRHNLACIASTGAKMHAYYGDVLGTTFSIANSFSDTTDLRYGVFAGLKGKIADRPRVDISNVLADDVLTEPTYPHTVYTFPDGTLTYRIIHGDDGPGNFAMVGPDLRIVNGTGVNWSAPAGRVLTIEASDGNTTDTATVSFSLGNAWYPADAQFVWDSIVDTDSTQIDPIIGNALPRSAGSTYAAVSGGLWDMDGVAYAHEPALIGGPYTWGTPCLFAAVLDKDNHTDAWVGIVTLGVGSFLSFYFWGDDFVARMYTSPPSSEIQAKFTAGALPSGKQVYWAYWDGAGELTSGVNQVTGESKQMPEAVDAFFSQKIVVGGFTDSPAQSKMKHGSTLALLRPGLTLAQSKAIVAKMQAHHGIA